MDDSVNLAYFSDPSVVLDYARAAVNVGLWASEKALFEKYLSTFYYYFLFATKKHIKYKLCLMCFYSNLR